MTAIAFSIMVEFTAISVPVYLVEEFVGVVSKLPEVKEKLLCGFNIDTESLRIVPNECRKPPQRSAS
jgi:hypothetical protein